MVLNNTLIEMIKALGNKNIDEMNEENKNLLSAFQKFTTVEISNAIFKKFEALKPFMEKVKDYKAEEKDLISVEQVNEWCSKHTHGKIKKIIGELKPLTVMILINAIYFKGKWMNKFNKKLTSKDKFYNYENKIKLVNFMRIEKEFENFEDDSIQAVSLKYKKDDLSALIILPKK